MTCEAVLSYNNFLHVPVLAVFWSHDIYTLVQSAEVLGVAYKQLSVNSIYVECLGVVHTVNNRYSSGNYNGERSCAIRQVIVLRFTTADNNSISAGR